jgi:hypothetical protein
LARRGDVLLIDDVSDADLVRRLRTLPGLRVVRAATPDAVARLSRLPEYAFRVALVSAEFPLPALEAAVQPLRQRLDEGDLVGLVFGERPGPEASEAFDQLGFTLTLWRPFDDHTLRFQLNRAFLRGRRMGAARTELRVPMECRARVSGGHRSKDAFVYSLSRRGAFLATPRPSATGARVEVNLMLPDRQLTLPARVVHTNVPGNLQRACAPIGMGVRFLDPSPHVQLELDRIVEGRHRALIV